jgi:hypothetical protein
MVLPGRGGAFVPRATMAVTLYYPEKPAKCFGKGFGLRNLLPRRAVCIPRKPGRERREDAPGENAPDRTAFNGMVRLCDAPYKCFLLFPRSSAGEADAIITAENSLIRDRGREELELLPS